MAKSGGASSGSSSGSSGSGSVAFRVELDEEEYRIVGPNNEMGPEVPYGDTATLAIDGGAGAMYYCHIENPEMPTEQIKVLRVDAVSEMQTETEDVVFGDDEGDDEDDDGAGDEDEEEQDQPPEILEPEPGEGNVNKAPEVVGR